MSLIYQSLKKLQSEDAAASRPGPKKPDGPSSRGFLRRTLLWLLPSVLFIALGTLIAWNVWQPPQQGSKPPRAATVPDKGNQTTGPNGSRQKNVAAKGPSDEESSERSQQSRGTQKIGTGTGAEDPSEKNEPQRLLHFACSRNGTRARLSLELRREPKLPETTWREEPRRLQVSLSDVAAPDPKALSRRAARSGLHLEVESADPLRFRLSGQRLREHKAFTLPGSGEYGPRCVIALRYAPRDRATETDSRQVASTQTEEPASDTPSGSGSVETEPGESQAKDPIDNRTSSQSLRIDSGTPEPKSRSTAENSLDLAKRLLKQGELNRATKLLRRHLNKNPGDSQARRILSRVLLREGQSQKAVSILQEGIRLDPESVRLRRWCAEILVSAKRYSRALAVLQMKNPPEPRAHSGYYALAAYARRKLGQHEGAARLYRTLADIEPDMGKWWMGLGLSLEGMERNRAALRAYERALSASGLNGDVRTFLRQRKRRLD